MSGQRPTPNANVNAMLLDAMSKLTEQLQRQNDFQEEQTRRQERQRIQSHSDQVVQEATQRRYSATTQGGLAVPPEFGVAGPTPPVSSRSTPPQPPQPKPTLLEDLTSLKQAQKDQGLNFRQALAQYGAQQGKSRSGPSASASVPLGMPGPQPGAHHGLFDNMDDSTQTAFTLAMLGEHGGPAWVRNAYLEQFALSRSLKWAQNAAQGARDYAEAGSGAGAALAGRVTGSSTFGAAEGALAMAAQHPWITLGGLKLAGGALGGVAALGHSMTNWENIGAQLGEQVNGSRYLFGFHNPLSPFFSGATSIGAGAAVNRQQLEGRLPGGMGMGSGLSSQQAKDAIQTIEGLGWGGNENKYGGGDIGVLANQLFGPLMKQYPGLSAADIGQFTPLLRNSGTSIDQLSASLKDLGTAAKATHETVGQAASSMTAFNEATANMGSQQGGMEAAQGFRNVTGMDPQVLGQMMNNPLMQGLAMSRYGVLPSGLKDVNPGTLTSLSQSTLQMLQRATAGLNHNIVDSKGNVIETGDQRQMDQIAAMMNMNVADVRRLLNGAPEMTNRNRIESALGGSSGNGFLAMVNAQDKTHTKSQQDAAQAYWDKNIAPYWKNTGISQAEMQRLSHEGFRQRITDLRDDMNNANASATRSQIQQKPNNLTVQVQFTGMAAKFFQTLNNPTTAKQAANAGKSSIASAANDVVSSQGFVGDVLSGNWAQATHDVINTIL